MTIDNPRTEEVSMQGISATRYAIILLLPLAVALLLLGLSYRVLMGFGELISPLEAAQIQENSDIRYDSSIVYRPRPYKILRAILRQRETLIVGSSRVMQFVSTPWNDTATNAGGAVQDIGSAEIFFDEVLAAYHPKRIILGVDWWWFAENRTADEPIDNRTDLQLSLSHYLLPIQWLSSGKITINDAWSSLINPRDLPDGIGMFAKYSFSGWDSFGHFDYGSRLTRHSPVSDIKFRESLEKLQADPQSNERSPAAPFSQKNWNRFKQLIDKLQVEGVEVIVVLPPVAQPLFEWLEKQPEPNLIKEVQRNLAVLDASYFDFLNPDTLAIPPCEFLDGFHAGEVAYLRILRAMMNDPASNLKGKINLDLIDRKITENSGRASLRSNEPYRLPEIDFLDLGCKK